MEDKKKWNLDITFKKLEKPEGVDEAMCDFCGCNPGPWWNRLLDFSLCDGCKEEILKEKEVRDAI